MSRSVLVVRALLCKCVRQVRCRLRQLTDRSNSQATAYGNVGTRETKTPLVRSEMRILLHSSTDGEQQSDEKAHNDRQNLKGALHNKNTKEHLN